MPKIIPSEFNRRITLAAYDYSQGDSGGSTKVLKESVEVWGLVEGRTGVAVVGHAQEQWNYDYKITIRHQSKFNSNWIVYYENNVLKINALTTVEEGYKRFMVLRCTTTQKIQSWS